MVLEKKNKQIDFLFFKSLGFHPPWIISLYHLLFKPLHSSSKPPNFPPNLIRVSGFSTFYGTRCRRLFTKCSTSTNFPLQTDTLKSKTSSPSSSSLISPKMGFLQSLEEDIEKVIPYCLCPISWCEFWFCCFLDFYYGRLYIDVDSWLF